MPGLLANIIVGKYAGLLANILVTDKYAGVAGDILVTGVKNRHLRWYLVFLRRYKTIFLNLQICIFFA